ncbi:Wzz/FepE/Etk N-terminal domain-containing protein [Psychrobacillus sp. PGGUH221]|uniref:YveK family protein n=1 Tax=Psychrobacillus sp. PGGUH221 TaxID=3020058 RepID=UPI0035C67C79
MEENINLHDIFKVIRKRKILILSVLLIIVTSTGLISYFFITPSYEASTQILINQKKLQTENINTQDIETNLQLINTYNVILKSPVILSKVIEKLDLKTTPELLTDKISVTSEQNSQVINIIVKDLKLKGAVEIANATAEIFEEEIKLLMNVDNVIILSPASNKKNIDPVSPNLPLNISIATIIGLLVGIGITFFIEYLDTSIKTEQDVRETINLPVLGLISPITISTTNNLIRRKRKR